VHREHAVELPCSRIDLGPTGPGVFGVTLVTRDQHTVAVAPRGDAFEVVEVRRWD
jgi:hypothetical protein